MAVDVTDHDRVRLVVINRPERRNAVDDDALGELGDAVESARSADVRVLVLAGAGGHFCAGADLTGVEDEQFATVLRGVLLALRDAPVPTIAAVEGAALGAGTQLAVACDLRTATADASFGIPAAKLGLMVDHWTVQRLAAIAGHGAARAMLLAADVLSGTDAHRLGLVQRLCPVADAADWATEIAALAPLTIEGHKLMLNRLDPPLPAAPDVAEAFSRAWQSEDFREGLSAFRERRRPRFGGR